MSDDWNNCIMVIILFIILFIYYGYLKTLLELKRDWRNFKCNPLYMLFSSLGKPKNKKHSENFKRCVNEVFDSKYSVTDVNSAMVDKLYGNVAAPAPAPVGAPALV
jgi:hypothetical protein